MARFPSFLSKLIRKSKYGKISRGAADTLSTDVSIKLLNDTPIYSVDDLSV